MSANSPAKVQARGAILHAEHKLEKAIETGAAESRMDACKLTHHFTAKDPKYGCHVYARELFIPKGTLLIGKIHRHEHLSFLLKGKISVWTEFGKKDFEAPCVLISEAGVKRMGYVEEDVVWVTTHLTEHTGEENLDKIEAEVIARSYEELGLIAATEEMRLGEFP